MALSVDIVKRIGEFKLNVSFDTDDEVLALLGASGCGKSMMLKCIAGIEKPDRGKIILNGRTLFDSERKINLKPQKRRVGYLFQQYALFPNMTVLQNIECGLREKQDSEQKIKEMIALMKLEGKEKSKPSELSGGQQQRVALARILVNRPDVLLLDEPFSALDAHLRFQTEREVAEIIADYGKTTLLVSHDRDEVYRLSDKVAIMNNGKIEKLGERHEVFDLPYTVNGARLTGCKNIYPVEKVDECHVYSKDLGLTLKTGTVDDDISAMGIRMNDISLSDNNDINAQNNVSCKVTDVAENLFTYTVSLKPETVSGDGIILLEIKKKIWDEIKTDRLNISIAEDRVLLLKDK